MSNGMFTFDFYRDTDESVVLCYFNFSEKGKFYVVSFEKSNIRISRYINGNETLKSEKFQIKVN